MTLAAPPLLDNRGAAAALAIEVHGMEVAYGKFPVLRGVSLDVRAGEVVALVGPNGAGKTTLLEALVGLRRRTAGTLRSAARELRRLPDFCAVFSYMPDDAALPAEVQVAALLAQTQRCSGAPPELVTELIGPLGLLPLRDARFSELSRGERRRVALFVALCTRRPVVVLDEPFGAFDPLQLLDILALLRARAARGVAFVLSIHQLADAEKIADRVLILHAGRVVAFAPLAALQALAGCPGASLEAVFLALLRKDAHAGA